MVRLIAAFADVADLDREKLIESGGTQLAPADLRLGGRLVTLEQQGQVLPEILIHGVDTFRLVVDLLAQPHQCLVGA